jgi:hypothetical protein
MTDPTPDDPERFYQQVASEKERDRQATEVYERALDDHFRDWDWDHE